MRDKVKITRDVLKRLGACDVAIHNLKRPLTLHVDPEKNIRAAEALINHPVHVSALWDTTWLALHTGVIDTYSEYRPEYGLNNLYVIAQVLAMVADNLTVPKRRHGA